MTSAAGDPRVQAMSLQDPKIFVALVCWAVYSFEVFAARAGLGRPSHGVSLGAWICDRAAEFRADQLFPDQESRLLTASSRHAPASWSASATARHPVELRERLDFQARGVESALRALAARGVVHEAVVLSTCNRAEIYAACDDAEPHATTSARSSATSTASTATDVRPHVHTIDVDLDAARHLFRVAAGLDSLVVGEPQILGQVKEAHAAGTPGTDRSGRCSIACSTRRSASASACGPKRGSAPAPCQ